MKYILLTNKYKDEPLKIVRRELPDGFDIKFLNEQTEECFIQSVCDVEYILAGGRLKISKKVLENASKLKMIQRSGVGLDGLDLNAIKEKGVPLYVNQGVNAESVAEHTLLLILSCLRRLSVIDHNTKSGIWKKQEQGIKTHELFGKTVGIIGMGNIAMTLVSMLKPFHVNILYYNLFRSSEDYEKENNMRFVSLEELFHESDIISVNCALTDGTRNLINHDSLSKMKNGAILVNTARGEIVEAQAVADALISGKLSFAGLDVHQTEPISDDYPLKNIENVILTPHIGGVTADSFTAMMKAAFRNIELFDKGLLKEIEQSRYI